MYPAHSSMPVWQFILQALKNAEPVVLLYVVESEGSSPGRAGFCMAICANGQLIGSIGGGMMEHKLVEKARSKINGHQNKTGNNAPELIHQVHQKKAAQNQSGMICSGRQTILLYLPSMQDKSAIQYLVESLEKYQNGCLCFEPRGLGFELDAPEKDVEWMYESEDQWRYQEKTGLRHRLYLVGGGHCSLALSQIMRPLDFYITVIDNRPQLNTFELNDAAHEKIILPNFKNLGDYLPEGKNIFVVLMSFGYRTDDEALRSLKNRSFNFMGVLGSQSKIDQLMQTYRSKGFDENWLKQIQAPVGIPIQSKTPGEIAISIAAAIIQAKNNHSDNG